MTAEEYEKRRAQLEEVRGLAGRFFTTEAELNSWMDAGLDLLFGASPTEVVIRGDAEPLLAWLRDRCGLT